MLIPVAILLVLVTPVFANFYDGFDYYVDTTQNPGPWVFSEGSSTGFTGEVLNPGTGNSYSPPNVYSIGFANAGAITGDIETATLSLTVNATSNLIGFKYYTELTNVIGSLTQNDITVSTSGTCGISTLKVITSYPTSWTQYKFSTDNILPTQTCTFILSFALEFAVGTGSAQFYVDNVAITGASAEIPSANFFLVNYASQTLFDIADYGNSSLSFQYTPTTSPGCSGFNPTFTSAGSSTCLSQPYLNNTLLTPDIETPSFASPYTPSLITAKIGGAIPYTRTFIPIPNALYTEPAPATQTLYLDAPVAGNFFGYTLTINDFSNSFPDNTTEIFILAGTLVITSGYLSGSQFGMAMIPGLYTVILVNPNTNRQYQTTLSLSSTNNSPSIVIGTTSATVPVGPINEFLSGLGWDCDGEGVTSNLTDTLGTTTQVISSMYFNSPTLGNQIIYSKTQTGSPSAGTPISYIYDFRDPPVTEMTLPNNASLYSIGYAITTSTGTFDLGPFSIVSGDTGCPTYSPPSLNPLTNAPFTIANSILGLNAFITATNGWEELFATLVIIATGAIFGARLAPVAPLAMGAEMGVFYLMSWGPLLFGVLSPVILFIGTVGIMVNRARRPSGG